VSPRLAPYLFGLPLSGLMSLIVSGVATWRALGADFVLPWLAEAWPMSWIVAFPTVLVVAPLVRRLVAALTRPGA
jgi:hypothetical protein